MTTTETPGAAKVCAFTTTTRHWAEICKALVNVTQAVPRARGSEVLDALRLTVGTDGGGGFLLAEATNRYVYVHYRTRVSVRAIPAMRTPYQAMVCLTRTAVRRLSTITVSASSTRVSLTDGRCVRVGKEHAEHELLVEHQPMPFLEDLPLSRLILDHDEAVRGLSAARASRTALNPGYIKSLLTCIDRITDDPVQVEANGGSKASLLEADTRCGGHVKAIIMPVVVHGGAQ